MTFQFTERIWKKVYSFHATWNLVVCFVIFHYLVGFYALQIQWLHSISNLFVWGFCFTLHRANSKRIRIHFLMNQKSYLHLLLTVYKRYFLVKIKRFTKTQLAIPCLVFIFSMKISTKIKFTHLQNYNSLSEKCLWVLVIAIKKTKCWRFLRVVHSHLWLKGMFSGVLFSLKCSLSQLKSSRMVLPRWK